MALFVVLKSLNGGGKPNQLELYVPFTNLPRLENEEIDFIQADGTELDQILDQFPEAPLAYRRLTDNHRAPKKVIKWFGECAKFIYFNL